MWPSSHSECSRTSSTCTASRRRAARAARATSMRSTRSVGRFSSRQLVIPPGEVARDVAIPTAAASWAAARRPRRRGRRTRPRGRGRRPRPAWCRSPPARAGLHTAPGMWASSNCRSVRTSTSSAPSPLADLELARGQRLRGRRRRPRSGPRLMPTIAWKFGGCGPSCDVVRATKRSSSVAPSSALCARSKPIVEETFMSIPGPPHSEPPRWPGQTSHVVGQRQQRVVQRAEDAARALLLVDREVGPGDVADEQRVAGQHRPRLGAARGVDQRERRVLGPVARACAARGRGRCRARAPSRRRTARARSRAPASRWMWIVAPVAAARRPWPETWSAWLWVSRMCSIAHAHVAREREVVLDVELRVDHRGHAGVLVADQIGRAAEVVVGDLAEDHRGVGVPR